MCLRATELFVFRHFNSLLMIQIFWNDSGELLCIATEESFFILRYSAEVVERAKEKPDAVTEDGIEDSFDVSSSHDFIIYNYFYGLELFQNPWSTVATKRRL